MSESDWKLLKVDKCSKRVCEEIMYAILNTGARLHRSHVFDHRSMLMMGSWTSADILVEIPRRMLVKSLVHTSNLDFFSRIRGVEVVDPPAQPVVN